MSSLNSENTCARTRGRFGVAGVANIKNKDLIRSLSVAIAVAGVAITIPPPLLSRNGKNIGLTKASASRRLTAAPALFRP
jgi:hypothetical protein